MVNLSDDTKERFDRLNPPECDTQDDFVSLLLDHYEMTDEDGEPELRLLMDRMDELEKSVPSKTEVAAYRGVKEALNNGN